MRCGRPLVPDVALVGVGPFGGRRITNTSSGLGRTISEATEGTNPMRTNLSSATGSGAATAARLEPEAPPPDPPVPAALLALFTDAEVRAMRREEGPASQLPEPPTAAQAAAAQEAMRRGIQTVMAWARITGCPSHILSRGWLAVENCRGWYREFGSWPTRDEFLTASGIDGKSGFTKWDRPTGEPMRRKKAVYRDGRWDRGPAARWNERIYGNPGPVASITTADVAAAGLAMPATRARGAGRPAARRAAGPRSGSDPGEDSESSEPPPAGRRICACGCGADISHRAPQARYLNDAHAAADRQRRKRRREWDSAVSRRDPYLRFDDKTPLAKLCRRVEEGCRCNGQHVADADDFLHCVKCGHRRGGSMPFISGRPAEARRARRVAA